MKVDCGYTENYLKEQNRMTGNCEIDCKDCPISDNNNKTNLPCGEFEYPSERLGVEELKKLQNANKGYIEYKIKQFLSSKEYTKKIDIVDGINDIWECKE